MDIKTQQLKNFVKPDLANFALQVVRRVFAGDKIRPGMRQETVEAALHELVDEVSTTLAEKFVGEAKLIKKLL